MKTRKLTFRITTALLLAIAAVGFGAWAAAAPGAAPSAQISGTVMEPISTATCDLDLDGTTRTCELWALPGTLDLPDLVGMLVGDVVQLGPVLCEVVELPVRLAVFYELEVGPADGLCAAVLPV